MCKGDFMVQNIGAQTNGLGSVNRIGTTNDGRVLYQVTDPTGQATGKLSVAQKDCDVFEKSYNDMMETAPKIQKFAEKHSTEEAQKKLKKKASWSIGLCTALGAGIGIFTTTKLKTWQQVLATGASTLAGILGGVSLASAFTTPSGISKFNKATQTISKLDIQAIQE